MAHDAQTEEIRRDNVSGAQQLTEKIARLIVDRFEPGRLSARESKRLLIEMARTFIRAQPAMAPVINLFNHLFNRLEPTQARLAAGRSLSEAAQDFARAMTRHTNEISARLFTLVRDKNVALTHSASQAVREGLNFCWTRGRRFSVICTESRPVLEGASLARAFATKGIPTCLVTDAQAFALLKGETRFHGKISLVLVGADSVSRQGITNKAGTLGLALAARSWSIPFYVLAGSEKFLPAAYPVERAIQLKPPGEILSSPPQGLTVMNRYFDVTPLPYITALVTEEGRLSQRQSTARLGKLALHPRLAKIVQEVL
jgi:translation initiation factor 2B subunit (eIF-2B alpha/beta/delta family)